MNVSEREHRTDHQLDDGSTDHERRLVASLNRVQERWAIEAQCEVGSWNPNATVDAVFDQVDAAGESPEGIPSRSVEQRVRPLKWIGAVLDRLRLSAVVFCVLMSVLAVAPMFVGVQTASILPLVIAVATVVKTVHDETNIRHVRNNLKRLKDGTTSERYGISYTYETAADESPIFAATARDRSPGMTASLCHSLDLLERRREWARDYVPTTVLVYSEKKDEPGQAESNDVDTRPDVSSSTSGEALDVHAKHRRSVFHLTERQRNKRAAS